MKKANKLTARIFSIILTVAITFNTAMPVFAQTIDSTVSSSVAENASSISQATDEASSAPQSADSTLGNEPSPEANSESNSEPNSDTSSSETSVDSETTPKEPPINSEVPVDSEAPSTDEPVEETEPFVPLQVDSFNEIAEIADNGTAKFSVKLNRDDVTVNYQWQVNQPVIEKEKELLFDYSSYSDTSYFFPFDGITEEELLAMNPEATWSGIEMYLEAVKNNGGNHAMVKIENGTENTYLNEYENGTDNIATDVPVWKNIDGANANEYIFNPTEETIGAIYRCVITITDEAYLQQAQANANSKY